MKRMAIVAGILAVVLAATLPLATGQPSRRDVVIGMVQEPDTLNSVITSTAATRFAIMTLMDYATHYDEKWNPTADIMESVPNLQDGSWRLLEGGKMRTVWKIRQGVKWSDGQDVRRPISRSRGSLRATRQLERAAPSTVALARRWSASKPWTHEPLP